MTSLLHRFEDASACDQKRQLAELEYVMGSRAAATALAENYVGLPLNWDCRNWLVASSEATSRLPAD
jgi:p-hydroxybenzoate 3-monooxygenase